MSDRLEPVHPGEILQLEFLTPHGMTVRELAKAIHVTPTRISEILRGKRGITADTALRLGRYFSTSPRLWLNLQNNYDLKDAKAAQEMIG